MTDRDPRPRRQSRSARATSGNERRGQRRGEERRGEERRGKRTSRNTDARNPTRSGIERPSRKFRPAGPEPEAPRARPVLRKIERTPAAERAGAARAEPRRRRVVARRRRGSTTEASEELGRLAGPNARRVVEQLARAAEAYEAGRERDAARLLRPLRDAYPDSAAVHELLGLTHYRLGQYAAAARELDSYVRLSDAVDQHPVLMDCMRAQRRYRRVDELWDELAVASPSSALVTEGRIVRAGSFADRGRVRDAIALLDRGLRTPKRVQEHHLRLWYVLADLYERAGEIPRARELFGAVRRHDAAFADVAERLAALG